MVEEIQKTFDMLDVYESDVWKQLATEIGGTYIPGDDSYERVGTRHYTPYGSVIRRVKTWTITLDAYAIRSDEGVTLSTTVYMKALVFNREGFYFSISPHTMLDKIGKFFGMQDIEVGDPEFDRSYQIQSTDESKMRALLANEKIKQLILSDPNVQLSLKKGPDPRRPTLKEVPDELYWSHPGSGLLSKNPQFLKTMFELFEVTLNELNGNGIIRGND